MQANLSGAERWQKGISRPASSRVVANEKMLLLCVLLFFLCVVRVFRKYDGRHYMRSIEVMVSRDKKIRVCSLEMNLFRLNQSESSNYARKCARARFLLAFGISFFRKKEPPLRRQATVTKQIVVCSRDSASSDVHYICISRKS